MGMISVEGTGRLVRIKGKMNAAIYRDILDKTQLECCGPQTGPTIHLQRPKAHSHNNKGQLCECP